VEAEVRFLIIPSSSEVGAVALELYLVIPSSSEVGVEAEVRFLIIPSSSEVVVEHYYSHNTLLINISPIYPR
jgi:hypothetical protein